MDTTLMKLKSALEPNNLEIQYQNYPTQALKAIKILMNAHHVDR